MKRYECIVCGWIYDEALGCPEEGIAPGTKWDDIPDDWTCPECGVGALVLLDLVDLHGDFPVPVYTVLKA